MPEEVVDHRRFDRQPGRQQIVEMQTRSEQSQRGQLYEQSRSRRQN